MTPNQEGSPRPSVGPSARSNGKASGPGTQVNDKKKKEVQRKRPVTPMKALIVAEVYHYHKGNKSLEEACAGILNIVDSEAHEKPELSMVIHCFVAGAVNMGTEDIRILPKFGHVLAYCMHKQNEDGRNEIVETIANFCDASIEFRTEIFREAPSFWIILAEVLSNALFPTPGLFEGAPPTLKDFKKTFIYAAKDTRKPYALFIQVLKRTVEIHCMREKDKYYEDAARKVYRKMTSGVAIEDFKAIIEKMDVDMLSGALKNTKTNFHGNLYDILQDYGCL